MKVVVRGLVGGAALVALMMFAACASYPAAPVPPVAGQTDSTVPTTLLPSAKVIPERSVKMLTAGQLGDSASMPWRLTSLRDDGRTIGLIYVSGDGDCNEFRGIYVSETARSVLIEVVSTTPATDRSCPDRLVMGRTTISLAGPLGSRALIHAVVSDQWNSPNFFRGAVSA